MAAVGGVALVAILYLMTFNPTLERSTASAVVTAGPVVRVAAAELSFDRASLAARAGRSFSLVFVNRSAHNVAIFTDRTARTRLFAAEVVISQTVVYRVPAVRADTYFFRCDVHPQMNGTFRAG